MIENIGHLHFGVLCVTFALSIIILVLASVICYKYDYGLDQMHEDENWGKVYSLIHAEKDPAVEAYEKATGEQLYLKDFESTLVSDSNKNGENIGVKKTHGAKPLPKPKTSRTLPETIDVKGKRGKVAKPLSPKTKNVRKLKKYQLFHEYLETELEDDLDSVQHLNESGLVLIAIDFAIRLIQFFLLLIGNKRWGAKCLFTLFIFISYAFLISYLVMYSVSLHRVKDLKKYVDDMEDYVGNNQALIDAGYIYNNHPYLEDYRDDLKQTKNMVIAIIVLTAFLVALQIFTLVIAFMYYICIEPGDQYQKTDSVPQNTESAPQETDNVVPVAQNAQEDARQITE